MTLVEFIAPLKNPTSKERVLVVLYYKQRHEGREALTTEDIRLGLKAARVPRWSKVNVADVVAKSGHYVDSPGSIKTVACFGRSRHLASTTFAS